MDWIRALLTVAFGALAGGVTNRVAVWMLFHPYRPPRLLGRPIEWLQGALPKNRERIASAIGAAVGDRLLTPTDLAAALRDEGLRHAFEERLREVVAELLATEHPSLSELLPGPAVEELRRVLASAASAARERALEGLESEAFQAGAARALRALAESLDRAAESDPPHPERVRVLRERAEDWLAALVHADGFEAAVRRRAGEAARELLRPERTLEEMIPVGAVAAVESAVSSYLPLAMERLGRLLEDPVARERVEMAVHDLLERFMRDLRFHQRVVARLIVTEETVERVVRTVEEEGTERIAALLREPSVQDAMARGVNEAVVEFLRRPVTGALGHPDDDRVQEVVEDFADWMVDLGRDPETRIFVLDQLEDAAWGTEEVPWSRLVRTIPPERVGEWLAGFLRSEPGRDLAEELSDRLVDAIVERPIGALGRYLGEEAADRIAAAAAPALWEWIRREIPGLAARVEIRERVEEKVRSFPLPELEELVRSVTQRELDLIVRLGYALGAAIGAVVVGVDAALP